MHASHIDAFNEFRDHVVFVVFEDLPRIRLELHPIHIMDPAKGIVSSVLVASQKLIVHCVLEFLSVYAVGPQSFVVPALV